MFIGAKPLEILCLLAVRTTFFHLYQLSHISYLQSTLYRVYLHFIHFSLLTEKEPLPQLVEVLPHAAARAATFLIFGSYVDCFEALVKNYHLGFVSILCSHADCFYAKVFTLSSPIGFNLTQSRGLCYAG